MREFLSLTFGGLTAKYYFRQLFFGIIVFAFMMYVMTYAGRATDFWYVTYSVLCTLLYPYARFAYETVVDFIIGDNIIITNFILKMIIKFISMVLCWYMAIIIAPFGLLFVYYCNRKELRHASHPK